jgi:hypothetical protein
MLTNTTSLPQQGDRQQAIQHYRLAHQYAAALTQAVLESHDPGLKALEARIHQVRTEQPQLRDADLGYELVPPAVASSDIRCQVLARRNQEEAITALSFFVGRVLDGYGELRAKAWFADIVAQQQGITVQVGTLTLTEAEALAELETWVRAEHLDDA